MYFVISINPGALPIFVAAPSLAVTPDHIRTCDSKEEIGNDQRIASCTSVVNDAAASMPQKANAYANRGKAYRAKGNTAAALRDLDQSAAKTTRRCRISSSRSNTTSVMPMR